MFTKRHSVSLHKKMKFSITDFFSKCVQICSLLNKSLMENLIFCVVFDNPTELRYFKSLLGFSISLRNLILKNSHFCSKVKKELHLLLL